MDDLSGMKACHSWAARARSAWVWLACLSLAACTGGPSPAPAPPLKNVVTPAPKPAPPPPPPPAPPAPVATAAAPPPPAPSPIIRVPMPDCEAELLAPFPWPKPPQYTSAVQIANAALFGASAGPHTLGDVARRLDRAITDAGYFQHRYLGVACKGFAIVLDLERLRADGRRLPHAKGFPLPDEKESEGLGDWVKRLFYAPPGFYRQIVFVVSEQNPQEGELKPSAQQLRRIAQQGDAALPPKLAALPYSWQYKVTALIYEFEKKPKQKEAKQLPPSGRLAPAQHLEQSRLFTP